MSMTTDSRSNNCFYSNYIFNYITFLLQFYFEVKIFVVEKIIVINRESQVVLFIPISPFRIIYVNITIHDFTINYYFYRHHYFTVFALQVISFVVLSIQLIIFSNRKLRASVYFECIELLYD